MTVDDASIFLAKFTGGAFGTFEATRMAPGRKNYNRFEINGSKGSLVWCFEDLNYLDYYSTEDPDDRRGFRRIIATEGVHPYAGTWWPPGHMLGYDHGFVERGGRPGAVHRERQAVQPLLPGRRPVRGGARGGR